MTIQTFKKDLVARFFADFDPNLHQRRIPNRTNQVDVIGVGGRIKRIVGSTSSRPKFVVSVPSEYVFPERIADAPRIGRRNIIANAFVNLEPLQAGIAE